MVANSMTAAIAIAGRQIGSGAKPFLIAEVGQAHDGSLGQAHAFVDAAARAGVDAIKFQTHIASAESTLDEEFRVRFSRQDVTRYDYWKRMEFTLEQWVGLKNHAAEKGLIFLSSAFSVAAVELLIQLGVPAWKVGSGEYKSFDLLGAMAATRLPVLLSTGMSRYDEIATAVEFLRQRGSPVALFQCTTRYPTRDEDTGLNVIAELRRRFACPVGLSDHSGSLWPAIAALAVGAELIEAHLIFDRTMFGPDSPSSLTVAEFRQLVEARDAIAAMLAHTIDKDQMAEELAPMRRLFTKSLAPTRPLSAGHRLIAGDLVAKKPGTGIATDELDRLLGKRLSRDVRPDRLLRWEDLDG
jgi:N,N'-diacetyllegionaminate synthase